MEGIVGKWIYGEYCGDAETAWVKIKNPSYSQMVSRRDQLVEFRRFAVRRGRTHGGEGKPTPRPEWDGAIRGKLRIGR